MYDPFDEISKMHEEMDRLFNRMFRPETNLIGYGKNIQAQRTPLSNIIEKDNSIVATFELPGADKKDIELNINEDSIEVKTERKEEKKGEYRYYRSMSSFYRKMPLPHGLDTDKARANYKDGVLKVEIPKSRQLQDKSKRLMIE